MSIKGEYFAYLDHFGQTVPVRELAADAEARDRIALRHDVDHDLDLALEMSYWEHEHRIRSTYYLLHTAPYWHDPQFAEKCLQIQDFGHEVGLHLNVLAEWVTGSTSDVRARLEELVAGLRAAGVCLSGVSTHGDRLCYERLFINYWCFSELRPTDPARVESGLSAEGVPVSDEEYRIEYPRSHRLERRDGTSFGLWSVSMRRLGLEYEASHVPCDTYYTDTGGGWHRSPDPIERALRQGRHQVLIHPIYWRGPQRIYFFLSTARSGSKWLASFLDKATPVTARHEFTLNHRYQAGQLRAEKRTTLGVNEFLEKSGEARQLLCEARSWIEDTERDYAEANVYLERFQPLMQDIFPDAALVHVHRDTRDVVRSILNRDWYDTPEDSRHPAMDVEGWDAFSQFEKACWYVRRTNESLLVSCSFRIRFDAMVRDLHYLTRQLKALGIPAYPRFALREHGKRINENRRFEFPEYDCWEEDAKKVFHLICDPVNDVLGYETCEAVVSKDGLNALAPTGHALSPPPAEATSEVLADIRFRNPHQIAGRSIGCKLREGREGIEIAPEGGRHAYLLFGSGNWNSISDDEGWSADLGSYYRGTVSAEICKGGTAQLFCLMYARSGELVEKRAVALLRSGKVPVRFSFKLRGESLRFNMALYMSLASLPQNVKLKSLQLERVRLVHAGAEGFVR